jgi:hypothetical protein
MANLEEDTLRRLLISPPVENRVTQPARPAPRSAHATKRDRRLWRQPAGQTPTTRRAKGRPATHCGLNSDIELGPKSVKSRGVTR